MPLDQLLSLVARVQGLPAPLVTGRVSLHEAPDWPAGDWHWRHAGEEEEPNSLIHLHPSSEELTWGGGKGVDKPICLHGKTAIRYNTGL